MGKFPFVPYVFNYFDTDDGAYLLREYIEGPTLSELVEKGGPFSLEKTVDFSSPLLEQAIREELGTLPAIIRPQRPICSLLIDHLIR